MSAEHIRHWRIGDVEVARLVEVNAFEDNISMLLKDETAAFVKQHRWLQPHFATPAGLVVLAVGVGSVGAGLVSVTVDSLTGAATPASVGVVGAASIMPAPSPTMPIHSGRVTRSISTTRANSSRTIRRRDRPAASISRTTSTKPTNCSRTATMRSTHYSLTVSTRSTTFSTTDTRATIAGAVIGEDTTPVPDLALG